MPSQCLFSLQPGAVAKAKDDKKPEETKEQSNPNPSRPSWAPGVLGPQEQPNPNPPRKAGETKEQPNPTPAIPQVPEVQSATKAEAAEQNLQQEEDRSTVMMTFEEFKQLPSSGQADSTIEEQWDTLAENKEVARDTEGPDGELRLRIRLGGIPTASAPAPQTASASASAEPKEDGGPAVAAGSTAKEDGGSAVAASTAAAKEDGGSAVAASTASGGLSPRESNREGAYSDTILKRAPPCRNYEDLRTMKDLREMGDEYESQETMSDIKELTGQMLAFKNCGKGLQASWKVAISDLETALKHLKTSTEQSEKEALKAKAKAKATTGTAGGSKRKKANGMLDILMEGAESIRSFDARQSEWNESSEVAKKMFQEGGDMRMEPYVISGIGVSMFEGESGELGDDAVAKSLKSFVTDFASSPWRTSAERAMRPSLDSNRADIAACDYVLSHMKQYCPRDAILPPHVEAKSQLRAEVGLTNFGLKQGSFHATIEKGGLWTARLGTHSRRSMVVLKLEDTKSHMRSQGMIGKDIATFVKEMGVSSAQAFLQSNYKVFGCTAAKGDLVWVPAHSVIVEQVADEADCFGLRFGMVIPTDTAAFAEFATVAGRKMTSSGHISKAVVALAAAATAAAASAAAA